MRIHRSRLAAALAAACLTLPALAAAAEQAAPAPAPARVNINQASATQLGYLPRIGPKVAARIIEYRKAHGPFSRPEELMEVKGIGEKLFLSLKPYIALAGATTLNDKVRLTSRNAAKPPQAARKPAPASVPVGKGR
jgi:competence protein ComEA